MRAFDSSGWELVPLAVCSSAAAWRTSASSRALVTFLALTRRAISSRSSSMPSPVRALVASTGTPISPSASTRRRTSTIIDSRRSTGTSSMWLRTTSITSLWVASGAR